MDDVSRAVTQFRLLVLKNGNREAFSICEMGRWEVRGGLLNSTTLKHVATKTEERIEIEILKVVAEGSKENFQKWVVERKCLRRMLCHPNLLHPLGYTMDENSLLVVHPSFEMRTLRNILTTNRGSLSCDDRITISVEAARGLAILHGGSPLVGFIMCFKDTNIHLDEINGLLREMFMNLVTGCMINAPVDIFKKWGLKDTLKYPTDIEIKRCYRKLYKFMDPVIRGQYASAAGFEMTRMILQCLANDPEESLTADQVWKQSQDTKNIRNL
ncbi:hypothetical protein ACE6H2_020652 [Prunus campanulata]